METTNLTGSIEWKYFFGGSGGNTFDRYYEADIRGMRCEKHSFNGGRLYAIGNIDKAKKKYKTEQELLEAINRFLTVRPDKTETNVRICAICNKGNVKVEERHFLKKGLSEITIEKCENCQYQHDLETIFDCELIKQ